MLDSYAHHLVVGVVSLLLVPSFCCGDPPSEKTAAQLKREVVERERQLIRAQRELAEAHARLALAEGKRGLAIAELRKVVAGHQDEVLWIRDHANWFCDPRDDMTDALWNTAKARVWLAEVERDNATLAAEWKKIVGFHEQQVERIRRLEQLAAVRPEERLVVQKALEEAREQLAAAEKKLAAQKAK